MGNVIQRLIEACVDIFSALQPHQPGAASRPHFASSAAAGLAALAHDLRNFETTSEVPEGLSQYGTLSKKTEAKRYAKISEAWKELNPSPSKPEEAATLVIDALQDQRDELVSLEEFLQFYVHPFVENLTLQAGREGVQFVLHTLPVDAELVGDGDGMKVHVDDAVPIEVQDAAINRRQARDVRDYRRADKIIISAGYRVVIKAPNGEEIPAREYRIRLRGIDAPEMNMEYGQEARAALIKLIKGKPLTIHVYEEDKYGRLVGDVYCNGVLIQEKLLRKGCAWHYEAYDNRRSFAKREARNAGRGLWANPNAVAPWEFKREERNKRNVHRQHQNRRNARRERLVRNQPC